MGRLFGVDGGVEEDRGGYIGEGVSGVDMGCTGGEDMGKKVCKI
jgi:hypothetical protein